MSLFLRSHPTKETIVVYPFCSGENGPALACSENRSALPSNLPARATSALFTAHQGECQILPVDSSAGNSPAVCLLLGLGSSVDAEGLRRAYAGLAQFAQKRNIRSIELAYPDTLDKERLDDQFAQSIFEGILLGNYARSTYKSQEASSKSLECVYLTQISDSIWHAAQVAQVICRGVYLARQLTDGNADEITPTYLAKLAQELQNRYDSLNVQVWDRAAMQERKLGLTLAVGQASRHEPKVILANYDSGAGPHVALIGKGVTFDTGGLCLKPSSSMATMRADMGGAAAVLGVLQVICELGLPCRVTALVPAVENAIGSGSYKPGDVYRACNGKMVEVDNTDAEGRLILAEMLHIATTEYQLDHVVDIATLTGAIEVALGQETAGLMSTCDELAGQLLKSGERTFERTWRLPLHKEYRELLNSEIADIKNSGGRSAGAISAACFLQEFVSHKSWAHLDIAGVAHLAKPKRYHLQNGTGFGVRLLTDWLVQLSKNTN